MKVGSFRKALRLDRRALYLYASDSQKFVVAVYWTCCFFGVGKIMQEDGVATYSVWIGPVVLEWR